MKILFDHQTFSTQRYGGISRYFYNLYKGFNQSPGDSCRIGVLYSENEYIKDVSVPLNNGLGRRLFPGHQNRIYRWNQRYSLLQIRKNDFDVFHPTYYDPYFLAYLKKPFVVTVHDMIHELMGDQFTDNNNVVAQKKLLIEKADAVIAISDYTKSDILKFYPEAGPKISVIHHGYAYTAVANRAPMELPARYILFVGERYIYKNFVNLLEAISGLLRKDKGLKLLCTGGGKFTEAEQAMFRRLGVEDNCRQINANEQELHQLYSQALVFVFPSLYEGFGFPLLEAFAAGCPVAASDNTCFPEIAGDAAIYFDPVDAQSINNAVEALINNEGLRNDLIAKGFHRAKQFSIQKQVNQTLAVYRSIAAG